ncbi:MAG TPA: alpha/beta hydrolase, partial [Candidatus Saccharimonadales bacterium]|nr:alpha/beta hydrolase [Candidatus Saccharimonadales bacterium]
MVAIGGLLTVKRVAFWYKPLLDKDTSTDVPAKERFIAPPDRGIGEPEELQKKMTEALEGMHDRLDRRKMFLVGHSLGGLIATVAALE